jgi:hypothetical protein
LNAASSVPPPNASTTSCRRIGPAVESRGCADVVSSTKAGQHTSMDLALSPAPTSLPGTSLSIRRRLDSGVRVRPSASSAVRVYMTHARVPTYVPRGTGELGPAGSPGEVWADWRA